MLDLQIPFFSERVTLHSEDPELQKCLNSMSFYLEKMEWYIIGEGSPKLAIQLIGVDGENPSPKSVLQVLEEALQMMKERNRDGKERHSHAG